MKLVLNSFYPQAIVLVSPLCLFLLSLTRGFLESQGCGVGGRGRERQVWLLCLALVVLDLERSWDRTDSG